MVSTGTILSLVPVKIIVGGEPFEILWTGEASKGLSIHNHFLEPKSITGLYKTKRFGLELIPKSSFTLSNKSILAVTAAKWPPAEPPAAAILLGLIKNDFAFNLKNLIADFLLRRFCKNTSSSYPFESTTMIMLYLYWSHQVALLMVMD